MVVTEQYQQYQQGTVLTDVTAANSLQAFDTSDLAFRFAEGSTSHFLFHSPALSTLHHSITCIHHPLSAITDATDLHVTT